MPASTDCSPAMWYRGTDSRLRSSTSGSGGSTLDKQVGCEAAVGQHDALGDPGGACGEHQHRQVFIIACGIEKLLVGMLLPGACSYPSQPSRTDAVHADQVRRDQPVAP